MWFYIRNVLAVLSLVKSVSAFSNDSAYVRFILDDSLNSRQFYLAVHDGINEHVIDLQKEKSWRGKLFSPLGHISIRYDNSDTTYIGKEVFFNTGGSKVVLMRSRNVNEYYFIDEKLSENLTSYNDVGGAAFDSFMKDRVDTRRDFIQRNRARLGSDTAILKKAFALGDSVYVKKFEFVRRFPDLYVSFWIFLNKSVKPIL